MRRWCARRIRMRASVGIDTARAQGDAGRARRVHRRRLPGRRPRADPARPGAEDQVRHEAAPRPAAARCSSARTCCCRPTRRAMSARRWRWWWRRRRRRRWTPPRRSRSTTRSCRSSSTPRTRCEPGAPAVWDEVPDNVPGRYVLRRRGRDRPRLRRSRSCRRSWTSTSAASPACRWSRAPALGDYDAATGRYTLYAGSGGAVRQKRELAGVLGIAPDKLRVLSYDVGGNFGTRNRVVRRVRPGAVGGAQARPPGQIHRDALGGVPHRLPGPRSRHQGRAGARRQDGRFLAHARRPISAMSARAACRCRRCRKGSGLITGSYDIPAATLRARAVFTNTMPTKAYRSSGRPEVTFAIERLIDMAADAARHRPHRAAPQEPGQAEGDAVPQRRRHALRQRHATRRTWTSRMDIADWNGFEQRQREAKKRGKLLGLGLAQLCRILDRRAEGAAPRSPCGRTARSTS